jgi:hypothetical protein
VLVPPSNLRCIDGTEPESANPAAAVGWFFLQLANMIFPIVNGALAVEPPRKLSIDDVWSEIDSYHFGMSELDVASEGKR